MARAAVADGITAVAATPHVRDDYPTTPETMERSFAELRAALARERVPLDLYAGGEIAIDRLRTLDAETLRRFGLGGNPSFLLVEFPYTGWPLELPERVFRLQADGITAVIAHPERNREVQEAPERLSQIVRAGGLVQLTAASVDGRLGTSARRTASRLIELGLAHLIASDAHAPSLRAIGMSSARRAVGDRPLAEWLTRDVPAAIVDGRELPHRPFRRGWWRSR